MVDFNLDGNVKRILGCTVAMLVLFSGSALAAEDEYSSTLTDMKGNVLVNAGQEYKKALIEQRLKDDYLVLVKEGEWFEISYDNGCDEKVEGPEIYTVNEGACGAILLPVGIGATTATVGVWAGGLVLCGALCETGGGDGNDRPVSP